MADVENQVREALLEAIDEGLLALGPDASNVIRYYAEGSYRVKLEDVPDKLEIFCNVLKAMLGTGGRVVEEVIARNLYNRLTLDFTKHDDWRLVDYVQNAKKLVSERK